MPNAIILAGPNGAGKSTAKSLLVPDELPFLNADNIARELREQGVTKGTDLTAGRILIQQYDEMVEQGRNFATETNLANHSLAARIPCWQGAGYKVYLFYLWVPSPEFAIRRVKRRVQSGGHDVPEATIRRRYYLGLDNFFGVYMTLVDRWRIYDSSKNGKVAMVARGVRQIRNALTWGRIQEIRTQAKAEGARP
jgi:predicted ABC-type ATPase